MACGAQNEPERECSSAHCLGDTTAYDTSLCDSSVYDTDDIYQRPLNLEKPVRVAAVRDEIRGAFGAFVDTGVGENVKQATGAARKETVTEAEKSKRAEMARLTAEQRKVKRPQDGRGPNHAGSIEEPGGEPRTVGSVCVDRTDSDV